MPVWAQLLIGVAAVVIASGVIWAKVLLPGARLVSLLDNLLPLLRDLNTHIGESPHSFEILSEIVAQFRTDSGSSLRDAVDRLEKTAVENRAAAEVLKVNVEAARQLSEEDRQQMANLIATLREKDARQQGTEKVKQ